MWFWVFELHNRVCLPKGRWYKLVYHLTIAPSEGGGRGEGLLFFMVRLIKLVF